MLMVLWVAPDGIVGEVQRWLRRRRRRPRSQRAGGHELSARTPASLAVTDLTIAFGGVKAATDVALTAEAGKITSLIGPNGAGKTTVLNLLAAFTAPTKARSSSAVGRSPDSLRGASRAQGSLALIRRRNCSAA